MSTIILVSFATAILLGSTKNLSFIAVGAKKIYVGYPQKPLDFLDGYAFRHSDGTSFLFQLAARRRVQRKMNCIHRSTEDVSNVSRRKRRPRTLLPPFTHPPPPPTYHNAKNAKTLGRFSGRRHKLESHESGHHSKDSPCDSRFSRVSAGFPQ